MVEWDWYRIYPLVINRGVREIGPLISYFPNKTSNHREFHIAFVDWLVVTGT